MGLIYYLDVVYDHQMQLRAKPDAKWAYESRGF